MEFGMYKSLNAGMVGIKLDGFEGNLALAKKYGYGAVSYGITSLEAEGVDVYRALDLMGQYGVIISDFGLPVQIASKAGFDETFPKLEPAARMAAKLGIHRSCTWMLSFSNERDYAENFRYHTKMLGLVAEVLNEYDIRFGIEYLGPKSILKSGKYPFVHTLAQCLELCDAIGTGSAGVMLDAHHCYTSGLTGGEFKKFIRSEKDIITVHLNDNAKGVPPEELNDSPRFYPGEPGGGANDLHGFMGALAELGYTGPVMAEPFSAALKALGDDNEAIAKVITESTNSVWPTA